DNGHTEDLLQQCLLLQQDELIALESIFPDCVLNSPSSNGALKLQISVQFGDSRSVYISTPGDAGQDETDLVQSVSVTTLPPLEFTITLPNAYPLLEPPKIHSVKATHAWLPEASALSNTLLAMWQLGDNVLYGWIDYLQTGDFLQDLGYISADDQNHINPTSQILASCIAPLLDASPLYESQLVWILSPAGIGSDNATSAILLFVLFANTHGMHGPVTACRLEHRDLVVQEYLAAEENSPEREYLERRYGSVIIKKLVEQHLQDIITQEWIRSSTTTCPGCQTHVQKSEGCNHASLTMSAPSPEIVGQEDIDQCQLLQKEEYEVLESIYPEFISSTTADAILKLEVPVEFSGSKTTLISESTLASITPDDIPQKKATLQVISIDALPPLLLQLTLPPSYPLFKPPEIVSIRAMHTWLPDVSALHPILLEMWQPGDGILYTWIEFIRTGEFLNNLKLLSTANDETILLPHPAPRVIAPLLQGYDESSKSNHFAKNSYPCSICLTSLKGAKCLQLSCGHIFCRSCLEDYWKMCIEEGDISRVVCPDPECVKQAKEAGEEEVARVVTETELQRWKWLRDKRDIERDPTVVHCPVAVCQTAIPKPQDMDPDSDAESSWNRLRQCPKCGFSFCAFCRRTWHGPLDKCPIAQYEEIALEYLAAEEGSQTRVTLEKRFGRANIRRLVATYEEEKANLQWLEQSTMMCPGCRCHVEKTLGCNHVDDVLEMQDALLLQMWDST
ncbi:hypothetical protein CVT24_006053, partial [Panaeolus cyanescens]